MQTVQIVLPAIATVTLGVVLLVPVRDDRRGRRATVANGPVPFRPRFPDVSAAPFAGARRPEDEPASAGQFAETRVPAERGVESNDQIGVGVGEAREVGDDGVATGAENAERERLAVNDDGAIGNESRLVNGIDHTDSPSSLIEPLAVIMAVGKPLLLLRTAWRRFTRTLQTAPASHAPAAHAAPRTVAEAVLPTESDERAAPRSFAGQLAALLGTPHTSALVVEAVAPRVSPPTLWPAERALETDRDRSDGDDGSGPRGEGDGECGDGIGQRAAGNVAGSAGNGAGSAGNGADRQRADDSDENGRNDAVDSHFARGWRAPLRDVEPPHEIVVLAQHVPLERMAPLTRLPLRPQVGAITWPSACAEAESRSKSSRSELSRAERHTLLDGMIRERGHATSVALESAYRQEDSAGRALVLRVYLRHFPSDGRAQFCEALRSGSDDERSVAIDGLAALNAREELTVAFDDRLDALAAKAALAYVGTLSRNDFRAELAPFVDAARIDIILALLAGIVE